MFLFLRLPVCLFALTLLGAAMAQSVDSQSTDVSANAVTTPAAHVFVNSGSRLVAFSAGANGKLTAIPGSPFNINMSLLAANGHYLFGFPPSSVVIQSLSIAANGALKKASTLNTETYNAVSDCPLTYWNGQGMRVDHSGTELYNAAIPADFPCRTYYQSFRIESNGALTFQNNTGDVLLGGPSINVLGNNAFAYTPSCNAAFGNPPYPYVGVFQRVSNGELTTTSAGVALPPAPADTYAPGGGSTPGFYCPVAMATDPSNHAAMTMYALDDNGATYGPVVIATYTADANGNLKTTSTAKNMATVPVDKNYDNSCLACSALRMAPTGKLLAAAGSAGVVLFHFNGGNPATKYRTLLAGNSISTVLWDNENHLYALGSNAKGAGMLWVYTVTPTSVAEAPGSPYSIANPGGMYVQPLK